MKVNNRILSDSTTENKLIYPLSTANITIGSSTSTLIAGGDFKTSGNLILDADIKSSQQEAKSLFTDIGANTLTIGSVSGSIILNGTATKIMGDITSDNEDKNIFVGVTNNSINVGGSASTVILGGELKVTDNIQSVATGVEKKIFTTSTGNIIIGENTQSVVKTGYDAVIGNNLTVKGSIITDVNENKNIFTDVTWNGAQSYNIQIGGLKSRVIIGDDLMVNGHIMSDSNSEDKNIFTELTSNNITIGGNGSTVVIGDKLKINGHIFTDNAEDKDIFTGIGANTLTLGSATGNVVSNNDLIVNKDITVKGTHIKSDVAEAKEIYTNIGQHSLTLGSSANSVAAKVIMNNNLQVNGKIFANDNTNKEVFVKQANGTADYTGDVLIGGTKTIIKGTLQTNLNITADTDEDKELWTNVTTNKITIGGLSSNTVIGNNLTVNGTSILSDANENKEIYTNVSTGKTITIGGSASTIVTGNELKIIGHILNDAA